MSVCECVQVANVAYMLFQLKADVTIQQTVGNAKTKVCGHLSTTYANSSPKVKFLILMSFQNCLTLSSIKHKKRNFYRYIFSKLTLSKFKKDIETQ